VNRKHSGVPRAGGLRPASPDPRWTYQIIHRWRPPRSLRFRLAPGREATAKRGRSGERQARRNHATSAAARRVRYARASQPPLPIRAPNTPRDAPLVDRDARSIAAQEGAGIDFFASPEKLLKRIDKYGFKKSEYPRSTLILRSASVSERVSKDETAPSWFETHRFAMLLTMRTADSIRRRDYGSPLSRGRRAGAL
jgi:hypothetical protein